jgi:hypothetical protein
LVLTHFAWLLPLVAALTLSDLAGAAQLTASWADNSAGQAAFEIDRRAQNEFDFSKIADLPAGSQSYVDSSVLEGVTYCYRVRAYTDGGESPYSDEACAFAPVSAVVQTSDFMLWITKAGTGTGGIVSASSEVCASSCTATFFPPGGVITLTAVPAAGSRFVGWSGACSGTGPCTVMGNTTVAVTATFNRI